MSGPHSKGDQVKWSWGNGEGRGKVVEVFKANITRTLKGTAVTRNATEDAPAYLIRQEDGDEALKSVTELEKV